MMNIIKKIDFGLRGGDFYDNIVRRRKKELRKGGHLVQKAVPVCAVVDIARGII